MQKADKPDVLLMSLQTFLVPGFLIYGLFALWNGDPKLACIDLAVASFNAFMLLSQIEKGTKGGKYNYDFFNQKVW